MPELPEVETTTRGIQKEVVGLKIIDVWTDLNTKDKRKVDTIANPKYFQFFKKEILNKKIIGAERRAKNILIHLENGNSILTHLKMTGHFLYGKYIFNKKENKWIPKEDGPLKDSFNRFIHAVFILSNGKHLALSDMRKFGKITLIKDIDNRHLKNLGIEPLSKTFNLKIFKEKLSQKPNGKIKNVLMDQSIIVGIGNIYSDEILFHSHVHPEKIVAKLNPKEFKNMFLWTKKLLKKGIDFGGDSMSDYRNIYGLPGKFQTKHQAYRRTGEKCLQKKCRGIIQRKIINNRSAHFCNLHQK